MRLLTGLFEASLYFDMHRMPELFCGSARQPGEGPVPYPVACAPQAWSAASVLLLLQACLGLNVNGLDGRISFANPCLPIALGELRIHNLDVAGATVDLLLVRHEQDVNVKVLRNQGGVEVTGIR
jgi:glycogen debranching enzyme